MVALNVKHLFDKRKNKLSKNKSKSKYVKINVKIKGMENCLQTHVNHLVVF